MRKTASGVTIILILWSYFGARAHACSTHGTVVDSADWQAIGRSDGVVHGVLTLETFLVPPDSTTTCTAAIGLGTLVNPAPVGLEVRAMAIVITNVVTGAYKRVSAFSLMPNATTTSAMQAGTGMSSPPNTNPLFEGSTWFGFSSTVEPFAPPVLGPDESTAFRFNVEVPETLLPLTLSAQYAGGQGASDGSPSFDGPHPVQYFTASDPTVVLTAPDPTSAPLLSTRALLLAIATLGAVGLGALTRDADLRRV